ncbi:uncharacterized protein [Aegilops tauschii subsp. strangulata]|uniref:uncharacterized protein isoform X4 n=1 Tax=Aegilops tauschii subsp. strangulata TaxID=200361 RepID=UPI003CC89A18
MTVSTTASLSTSSAQPPLRPRSQHRPTGDCLPCHARGQTHHHYHEVVARHWGMCRTRTSRTMQLLAKHWHRNMAGVEAVLPLQGGEPGRLQACPQLQPLPNPTRLIKFPIQLKEVLRYSLGNKGESICSFALDDKKKMRTKICSQTMLQILNRLFKQFTMSGKQELMVYGGLYLRGLTVTEVVKLINQRRALLFSVWVLPYSKGIFHHYTTERNRL